jgi:hypothetical protein
MLKAFAKLLLAFAPWIAFLLIAHGSLARVRRGLVVALALSAAMGLARLHRGIILWVGLVFFAGASVAVIGFEDAWTLRHMGVLANGALAAGAWLTILAGRPFTLDYARAHTDPALWEHPAFLRTNYRVTALWACAFTLNAGLAFLKMNHLWFSELAFELMSYALLVGCALISAWVQARRRAAQGQPGASPHSGVSRAGGTL